MSGPKTAKFLPAGICGYAVGRYVAKTLEGFRMDSNLEFGDVPCGIHEVDVDIHLSEFAGALQPLLCHKLEYSGITVLEADPTSFVNHRNTRKGVFTL